MFTIFLILILFLPGALLPLALETSFTSSDLVDMGVYLEDAEPAPISNKEPLNRSQAGSSRLRTSLPT